MSPEPSRATGSVAELQRPADHRHRLIHRNPLLTPIVTVADRHRVVLERLAVDRQAVEGPCDQSLNVLRRSSRSFLKPLSARSSWLNSIS